MTTPPEGEQPGAYPPPGGSTPAPPGWGQPPSGQPPSGQPPSGPGGYPSYAQPGHSPYGPPPAHPEATKALVLGIVSLAGGFTCYLPILLSPVAWFVGHRVVREIDAVPFAQGGRGEARAGMILGIIGTAILALGVGVLILILGLASAGA